MKVIAFIEGRPKPQPRVTTKAKFLFGKSYEQWQLVDKINSEKAKDGLINKLGNPYKETRYAYRLKRLQAINEYRANVYDIVCRACNNGKYEPNCSKIPKQNLFFFYLFKIPTRWKKARKADAAWTIHEFKPDAKNLWTSIEDAIYDSDSECSHVAHYKLYIPDGFKEGVMILHDEEIHKYVVDIAKDFIIDVNKKATN